jgi:hypothetical protein
MSLWQCGSCGGTYSDTCPDGSLYFHACPPIKLDTASNPLYSPDRRDENLLSLYSDAIGVIRAEGKGRAPAPAAAPDTAPPPAPAGFVARVWNALTGG